jgi:hypothetical protein
LDRPEATDRASVLVTYFDEVKHEVGKRSSYWLAGIVVHPNDVRDLEGQMSTFAQSCFGTGDLAEDTEFHASALVGRRDHFKEWETGKRIAALKSLLGILDQHDRIGKVHVRLYPERMVASDIAEKAFMFFTEKVEALLESRSSVGLLIGDRENDKAADAAASALSGYRSRGTPYNFGALQLRSRYPTPDRHGSFHAFPPKPHASARRSVCLDFAVLRERI